MLVDRLQMLPPQNVPAESLIASWSAALGDAETFAAPGFVAQSSLSNIEAHARIKATLDKFPDDERRPVEVDAAAEDAAHDAYFHVERVDGNNAGIFVRMALSARAILLAEVDEAPVSISRRQLAMIDRGLADLASSLMSKRGAEIGYVENWKTRGTTPRVMSRWVRGHQIFAALTQGLLYSLAAMSRAVRSGNADAVSRWADLSISLLQGSGACFVLTGDFTVEDYTAYVRPSMMPPASPICLSGLMSVDHRLLVQTLRDMKPALKSLRDHDAARYDRLHEELKTVYDQHIHVCERFVGDRPSLLTAGRTEKSGPELIEQFKALRLKAFDTPRPAARLSPDALGKTPARCPMPERPAHSSDLEPGRK